MLQTSTWSLQRSAWLRTAAPEPETTSLDGPTRTGVLVVGAGFAGLNAALRLLERSTDVIVVEANGLGFGASGRNGGQVIPGIKHDPSEILSSFGEARGRRLVEFAGNAADATFDLIRTYGLDCHANQSGWLQPAVDQRTLELIARRARSWSEVSGISPRILDRDDTQKLTGSQFYCGGWIDPRGGQLQPLSYVRELARVVLQRGGRIFSNSRALRIRRAADAWNIEVNGHDVTAQTVIICTNGYVADLLEGLERSLIPASSVMAATEPLSDDLRSRIMPSGLPISDARRIMNYIRFDPDGRLLIGARGSFGLHEPASDFKSLKNAALRIFPQLEGVNWQDEWGGLFCLTRDFLPHLHNPEPGLFVLAGCNGRGVALLSQLGGLLGKLVAQGDLSKSVLPPTDIRPIPFHELRRFGLEAILQWYRVLDRLHV